MGTQKKMKEIRDHTHQTHIHTPDTHIGSYTHNTIMQKKEEKKEKKRREEKKTKQNKKSHDRENRTHINSE